MKDSILSVLGVTVCVVLLVLPFTITGDAADNDVVIPHFDSDYQGFLAACAANPNGSMNRSYQTFLTAAQSYDHYLIFWCQWISSKYGSQNAFLAFIGSSEPIKFVYSNGAVAVSSNADSECRVGFVQYYSGAFRDLSNFRNPTKTVYTDYPDYSFFNASSMGTDWQGYFADADVNTQRWFYSPGGESLGGTSSSTQWILVDGEAAFYDDFTDDRPHGAVTTVTGGSGAYNEDWYSYQYDTDQDGNYIPGSGNIDFDFGAGDKAANFLNRGFFGEIRSWIREGNEGVEIEPITLFDFDTTLQGKTFHSPGITIDPNDRSSLLSLLAFIVIPVYMFEVLCNLWGIAFRTLTGVDLISIKGDPTDGIPVPDDDDALWLM